MRVLKFVVPVVALALFTVPAISAQTPARVQVQSSGDHPPYRIHRSDLDFSEITSQTWIL
jgi:hypothetical protein